MEEILIQAQSMVSLYNSVSEINFHTGEEDDDFDLYCNIPNFTDDLDLNKLSSELNAAIAPVLDKWRDAIKKRIKSIVKGI